MNTDFISKYLEENISAKRRKHILGVVETSVHLANIHGADPEKARVAALYHDMFKERDLNDLVLKYGLDSKYLNNRNLAHSKVAAAYMEKELGIFDGDLLNAVSYHTTGRAGMSKLEQIIFLADAIEPNRDYPGVDEIRAMAEINLDKACLMSLSRSVDFVLSKNEQLDEDTLIAEKYYEERV